MSTKQTIPVKCLMKDKLDDGRIDLLFVRWDNTPKQAFGMSGNLPEMNEIKEYDVYEVKIDI